MPDYRVLLPLDGSRYAEHALAFLSAMQHFGEVHVELLSVLDDMEFPYTEPSSEDQERERNLLATYLHEIGQDVTQHLGMTVTTEVLHGNPSEVIVEKSRRLDMDAIMIATHGRSGATRWRRGSVADKVVRTSHVPVFIVGPNAMEQGAWLETEAAPPFSRILVPLDGSETSERALPVAARFVKTFGSVPHLFQAIKLGDRFDVVPGYRQDVLDGFIGLAKQYLTSVQGPAGLPEDTIVNAEIGSPAELLEAYIVDHDIDLIVMTSHGRGGLSRAALGSITDRLVGVGPPVLVIREP